MHESAWLADLVAAFILENTAQFFEEAVYDGIYRDDGLVVFLKATGPNNRSPSGLTTSKLKLTRFTRNEELPGGRTFLVTCYHALRAVYAGVSDPQTGKCIRK
jgi:hypothetical protein